MRRRSLWLSVRAVFLALVIGAVARGQSPYRQIVVPNGGSVSGTVRLQGIPPREVVESMTKDADYCGLAKTSQRLIVGRDGGVMNAVIWIERITEGKKYGLQAPVTLHQKKCEYDPHVLILHTNEQLEIVNEDPVLHNVHAFDQSLGMKSMFNIAQPVRGFRSKVGQEQVKGLGIIMTTCDAGHPWMRAYIIRASHPYYALTDASGRYRLDDVPPGTYVLRMWHEGIATSPSRVGSAPSVEEPYEQTKQLVVEPYGSSTLDFSFSLRSATASK